MKAFSPDKELKKIQKGNKNKVIIGVIALLIILGISSSYALYQVRYSKRIIYTKVADFSRDLNLAVYVDGEKQTEFPDKRDDIIYTNIDCNDNKVTASWNYDRWGLEIYSKLPNKCNVYFETRWKDKSGASYPELYQGLIPITIRSNGEIKVADLSQRWYNYDEHEWANAVLVTDAAYKRIVKDDGTFNTSESISLDTDILQMYVWIPRYKYKLFNAEYGTSEPQEIEIEFESNTKGRSMGTNNEEWLTHPAFLFGNTELNGFWVGKFEPSDPTDPSGITRNKINEITILPDKISLTYKNVYTMFNATRKIESTTKYNLNSSEIDTHVMKNMDWGAVTFLTRSKYGRCDSNNGSCTDVRYNNTMSETSGGGTITGCSATSDNSSIEAKCNIGYKWNEEGHNASTTDNMYGIYDMAGGAWEIVMGISMNADGTYNVGQSGFTNDTLPLAKYYNSYITKGNYHQYSLGDATRETIINTTNVRGWLNTEFSVVSSSWPWVLRGGVYSTDGHIWTSGLNQGSGVYTNGVSYYSFRVVLTAQDGTD